jgi:hypothetical protein
MAGPPLPPIGQASKGPAGGESQHVHVHCCAEHAEHVPLRLSVTVHAWTRTHQPSSHACPIRPPSQASESSSTILHFQVQLARSKSDSDGKGRTFALLRKLHHYRLPASRATPNTRPRFTALLASRPVPRPGTASSCKASDPALAAASVIILNMSSVQSQDDPALLACAANNNNNSGVRGGHTAAHTMIKFTPLECREGRQRPCSCCACYRSPDVHRNMSHPCFQPQMSWRSNAALRGRIYHVLYI